MAPTNVRIKVVADRDCKSFHVSSIDVDRDTPLEAAFKGDWAAAFKERGRRFDRWCNELSIREVKADEMPRDPAHF